MKPKNQPTISVLTTAIPAVALDRPEEPEESSKQLFDRVKREVERAFKRQQRQMELKKKKAMETRATSPVLGNDDHECRSSD